ncbi:MAG: PAS domain-containing sensor histidine kinase [Euryarchaeota archaeon]|nr:PAS domain-containing sensor histidine kinase [Euryarchaeota archaeon]
MTDGTAPHSNHRAAESTLGAFAPYPYHSLDDDGVVRAVNDAWLDTLGYDRVAVEGTWFGEFLTAPSTETFETRLETLDAEGTIDNLDLELLRADGGTLMGSFSARGEVDSEADTDPVRTHWQFSDITEQARAESETEQARSLLGDVMEAVPHPLYVIDAETYTIEQANAAAAVTEGSTCYEMTHDREEPCHEGTATSPCPLESIRESREPTTVEHTHYDTEGTEQVHEIHAAPTVDADGEVERIVESIIDITERAAYEQHLKQQRDDLDVLNQVLRHDMRNDLQLVLAYSEMLEDVVPPEQADYLETVIESAQHAVELTTTARDMSDLLLDKGEETGRASLRSALETELDKLRSTYTDADITVEGTIPDATVTGNDLLNSVFRNLLKNAIQHNDKPVPAVTVSVTDREDVVTVEIADNGPGVPDHQKDEIFGKGEKGLESAGTGIGLYLVQTLVGNYGGEIDVHDNDPEGAVFSVTLPRADDADT